MLWNAFGTSTPPFLSAPRTGRLASSARGQTVCPHLHCSRPGQRAQRSLSRDPQLTRDVSRVSAHDGGAVRSLGPFPPLPLSPPLVSSRKPQPATHTRHTTPVAPPAQPLKHTAAHRPAQETRRMLSAESAQPTRQRRKHHAARRARSSPLPSRRPPRCPPPRRAVTRASAPVVRRRVRAACPTRARATRRRAWPTHPTGAREVLDRVPQ